MKKSLLLISALVMLLSGSVWAQTPLWQGKGRIVISSDGNEHDSDDWAATPLSLALLSASGLQDYLVLYTYCDHIWGSNQEMAYDGGPSAYEQMHESALGAKEWFGFDNTKFFCAVDCAEVAYNAIRDEINASTENNPLIIVAAGPMQVVGEALARSNKEARKYVTVLSHSRWNDVHADNPYGVWDVHSGWTWNEMEYSFGRNEGGNVKFVHIADQNHGKDYEGLMAPKEQFDWIKTSKARNNSLYKKGAWDWLYSRQETVIKDGQFDPSDAGMIVYLLTGIEKTDPAMAKDIMENPKPKQKVFRW